MAASIIFWKHQMCNDNTWTLLFGYNVGNQFRSVFFMSSSLFRIVIFCLYCMYFVGSNSNLILFVMFSFLVSWERLLKWLLVKRNREHFTTTLTRQVSSFFIVCRMFNKHLASLNFSLASTWQRRRLRFRLLFGAKIPSETRVPSNDHCYLVSRDTVTWTWGIVEISP